jgi:hypothetical protein
MKIAVCLSSQLRMGLLASKNLKRFFGEYFDKIDFFIHTWDQNSYRNVLSLLMLPRPPAKISKDDLDKYKEIYNPISFIVEDQESYIKNIHALYGNTGELINLYHSRYCAILAKREWEEKNNFKYDVVVNIRPDMLLHPEKSFSADLNDYLTAPDAIWSCCEDDFYHIGSSHNMDVSGNFYLRPDLKGCMDWPMPKYTEYMRSMKIEFKFLPDSRFSVLRQECEYMDPVTDYLLISVFNAYLYNNIAVSDFTKIRYFFMNQKSDWVTDMYSDLSKVLMPDAIKKIKESQGI